MIEQKRAAVMQCEIVGSGEGLVLMPGGLTGWRSLAPHAEILSARRRVIRLQLLNVQLGLENRPLPETYGVQTEVAALERTVEELQIGHADFLGWSYGGLVTLSYAIHHPERVRSLTLIEPPAYWTLRHRGPWPEVIREQERTMSAFSRQDISEEELVIFLHQAGLVPDDIDPQTLPAWPKWVKYRQSMRMGDAPFRHVDSIESVRVFDKPVLLVKGEGPGENPHHPVLDVLLEELPNAQLVTLPGGHGVPVLSREAFLARLEAFLG